MRAGAEGGEGTRQGRARVHGDGYRRGAAEGLGDGDDRAEGPPARGEVVANVAMSWTLVWLPLAIKPSGARSG